MCWAGGPRGPRHISSKATLCGVSVVEQLGLTVGQDLNLRRIWTLADARRHQSVQILETCHLQHIQKMNRGGGGGGESQPRSCPHTAQALASTLCPRGTWRHQRELKILDSTGALLHHVFILCCDARENAAPGGHQRTFRLKTWCEWRRFNSYLNVGAYWHLDDTTGAVWRDFQIFACSYFTLKNWSPVASIVLNLPLKIVLWTQTLHPALHRHSGEKIMS